MSNITERISFYFMFDLLSLISGKNVNMTCFLLMQGLPYTRLVSCLFEQIRISLFAVAYK